jgi:hypothetical protein
MIDDDNSEGEDEDARQSRALRRATSLAERKPRLHPIVGDEEGASSRRGFHQRQSDARTVTRR